MKFVTTHWRLSVVLATWLALDFAMRPYLTHLDWNAWAIFALRLLSGITVGIGVAWALEKLFGPAHQT